MECFCTYCGARNLGADVYCKTCGRVLAHAISQDRCLLNTAAIRQLIEQALIARDQENSLWSRTEVEAATSSLNKKYGGVPTLEGLEAMYGKVPVREALFALMRERHYLLDAIELILRVDSGGTRCHGCGAAAALSRFVFGLAKIVKETRDWVETIASVAVSAVSLPLTGFGVFQTPGRATTANILRLHLLFCPECTKKRTRLFGNLVLSDSDYELHPCFVKARQLGYSRLLAADPLQTKR